MGGKKKKKENREEREREREPRGGKRESVEREGALWLTAEEEIGDEVGCHVAPLDWPKVDLNYPLFTKVQQFLEFLQFHPWYFLNFWNLRICPLISNFISI